MCGGEGVYHCAAVGNEADDAEAGEFDEGFADGGGADAEHFGDALNDEFFAGGETVFEYGGEEAFGDLLAQAGAALFVIPGAQISMRGEPQACPSAKGNLMDQVAL